jgi:hypothetical protein
MSPILIPSLNPRDPFSYVLSIQPGYSLFCLGSSSGKDVWSASKFRFGLCHVNSVWQVNSGQESPVQGNVDSVSRYLSFDERIILFSTWGKLSLHFLFFFFFGSKLPWRGWVVLFCLTVEIRFHELWERTEQWRKTVTLVWILVFSFRCNGSVLIFLS